MLVWGVEGFVFLAMSCLVLVVAEALLAMRRASASQVARGVWSAALVVMFPLACVASEQLADALFRLRDRGQWFVSHDHSPLLLFGSAIVPLFLLVVSYAAFSRADAVTRPVWRAAFDATSLAFAALNLANFCSPGYCDQKGFPFTYYTFTDAFILEQGPSRWDESAAWMDLWVYVAMVVVFVGVFVLTHRRRPVIPSDARDPHRG